MNYLRILGTCVKPKRYSHKELKRRIISIRTSDSLFTSISLYEILAQIKGLLSIIPIKQKQREYTISFDLKKIEFSDKITYLLLDAILYELFLTTEFEVVFNMEVENNKCIDYGFKGSVFYRIVKNCGETFDKSDFIDMYTKNYGEIDIFRKFYSRELLEAKEGKIPSLVLYEVDTFLKIHFTDIEWTSSIAEAISELIDNSIRHSNGDVLIDIDISEAIKEMDSASLEADKIYKSVNIAFINLSDILLYDKIKENIKDRKFVQTDKIYEKVYRAYDNHKQFFTDMYTEDFFFLITAFQKRVTTREYFSGSNGTGLTTLIESILETTDDELSYVLSGYELLRFQKNYLKINSDFIGFNSTGNYVDDKPDENSIYQSALYISGTIYNLSLIKGEKDDNGKFRV